MKVSWDYYPQLNGTIKIMFQTTNQNRVPRKEFAPLRCPLPQPRRVPSVARMFGILTRVGCTCTVNLQPICSATKTCLQNVYSSCTGPLNLSAPTCFKKKSRPRSKVKFKRNQILAPCIIIIHN